jgi:hypothetical protein
MYFDRFPNTLPNRLTPDFTVLFNENYGLIFEVKRTFPKDDDAFKKEIKQLLAYDAKLALKADDSSNRVTPTVHDIVLVISATNSYEIFNRFNKLVSESGEFKFENNVILMEYFYHTGDRDSRYIFRKFMGENRKFRDELLPTKKRFEYILGEKAQSFSCYPRHFIKYKVNKVLCNDKPPGLYMAVYLWTKVFYNYLSDEQKKEWRRGNSQRIQSISISVDELLNNLNSNYIPKGNIRKRWLTDSIRFLEDAGLAFRPSDRRIEIRFRNLTQMIGHRKYTLEGEAEQEKIREYAHLIADQYCKNIIEEKKPDKKAKPMVKKGKQTTLFNN